MYLEVNDLYIFHTGNLSKTCTADGWTEMDPMEIAVYCGYNLNGTIDDVSTNCLQKLFSKSNCFSWGRKVILTFTV